MQARRLRLLRHPLTAGLALDDPATTARRRQVLARKRFLNQLYREWYAAMAAALPPGPGPALELGSGAGFLARHVPGLITSDVVPVPELDLRLDARRLPLADRSLRALLMTDVLHHIPDVGQLLWEAARVLRPGGALVMVEPWLTPLSRVLLPLLQDEPLDPGSDDWRFPAGGPLSAANLALPWIVFERDREALERRFPSLRVAEIRPMMPLAYVLSGGLGSRLSLPGWSYRPWRALERAAGRWEVRLAMFALIVVRAADHR
jgi:SAM-dependent methyltransferase